MFFKKLWTILIRIFLCCVPYWGYIRTGKKEEAAEEETSAETDAQEQGKTE